jgi:hypothetical protein
LILNACRVVCVTASFVGVVEAKRGAGKSPSWLPV